MLSMMRPAHEKERWQGWPIPPSLTPCCGAVPLEAYLVAGFFLASFCLLCFWVFFGDLSPMMVLLSQATPRSLAAYFSRHKDYSTKSQVLANRLSRCTCALSRI